MVTHKNQVGFIKKWEGGLSNDPRDKNPASYPAPCSYRGQTGWHTNKGITYATFYSNAKKLGYTSSCENFFAMPDAIWLKIYKAGFWDKFLLDSYRSQSIADVIVSLAWGSGINSNFPISTGAYSSENAKAFRDLFNRLTRTAIAEKRVHTKLLEHYRQFYISLNNPTYIRGWLRRVGELDTFTQDSLRANNELKKIAYVGLAAVTVAALSLIGYYVSTDK
jgi:hypothetical protein